MFSGSIRCILCGKLTPQRCSYCREPICARCQVRRKGKVYCSERHRDQDAGIGHLLRRLNQPQHIS